MEVTQEAGLLTWAKCAFGERASASGLGVLLSHLSLSHPGHSLAPAFPSVQQEC